MNRAPVLASFIVLTIAAFTFPALAQSLDKKADINSAANVAASTADFVQHVALGDMFEIQSGKLADDKAMDAHTKAFARQMVADHTRTAKELKRMVDNGTVKHSLPTALDAARQKILDRLKNLKGKDFAEQYRSDQIAAHQAAVSLFERYAASGDNAVLKDWAAKTLPALRHHLEMAQNLEKSS